ncbi:MAG: hypothetical protein ACI8ZN_001178 [Bacteroidia bacterium]|jgi:hypothetical protein
MPLLKNKSKQVHITSKFLVTLIILCLAGCSLFKKSDRIKLSKNYENTPVIIQIPKDNQGDTLGFKLVEDFTKLVYKKVKEGQMILWDSPAKKFKITPLALERIEEQNNIVFNNNHEIFIYEYWKLFKKQFDFEIIGFSFFNRLPDGTTINFGYLDAEASKNILTGLIIPTNANGPHALTYWNAIMCKAYNFNLVKFWDMDFKTDPRYSFALQYQAFNGKNRTTNAVPLSNTKEIIYSVFPGIKANTGNAKLCIALQNYFNANRHEYFNNTNNPVISFADSKTQLEVTRVEITELWNKSDEQHIQYQPLSVIIYINNKPMKQLSIYDLDQFNILINFRPIDEYLREKDFTFNILRVNQQDILGFQSDQVLWALRNDAWNKVLFKSTN